MKQRFRPSHGRDDRGIVHWWLFDTAKRKIIDVTADQYFSVGLIPPYDRGRLGSFLTNKPSKRCLILMDRVESLLGSDFRKCIEISESKKTDISNFFLD
jgi:hypothetical protein